MGEWRYSSTILDLGTRWRCVVSFTLRILYTRGKEAPVTNWIGGWVGPRVGADAVKKNKSCTAGNVTRTFQPIPIELFWH
jgi:hypothetical protein